MYGVFQSCKSFEKGHKLADTIQYTENTSGGYIIPHFSGSGFNNQVQQILNSVAIARSLNRTYCLAPFLRRTSDESSILDSTTTNFQDIFSVENLSEFVSVASINTCSTVCDKEIDLIVNMSPIDISNSQYGRQNAMKNMGFLSGTTDTVASGSTIKLSRNWLKWSSDAEIKSKLGSRGEKCMELYQPFPVAKIIVDGDMSYLPLALKFRDSIYGRAEEISRELFGGSQYISVHWRYELQPKGESKCRKRSLKSKGSGDTCFVVFLKRNRTDLKDYLNFGGCEDCEKFLQFVHIEDLGRAIKSYQKASGGLEIYLASDAPTSVLKKLGKIVPFKMLSDSSHGQALLRQESIEIISVIEQAICVQSKKFVGTSYSTWTSTVWMLRTQNFPSGSAIFGFLEFLSSGRRHL